MALLVLLVGPALSQGAKRPNILLLFADDMGDGDLGCYGSTQIRTPHLDQLASAGVRCMQAYVTGPVCAPVHHLLERGFDRFLGMIKGHHGDFPTSDDHQLLDGTAPLTRIRTPCLTDLFTDQAIHFMGEKDNGTPWVSLPVVQYAAHTDAGAG